MIHLMRLIKKGALCAFLLLGIAIATPATPVSTNTPTTSNQAHIKYNTYKSKKQNTHKKTTPTKKISTHPTTSHHYGHNTHYSHRTQHYVSSHRTTHSYYKTSAFKPTLPTDFNTPTDLSKDQNAVCSNAEAELGTPYVWGGTSPNRGFDCSGFSQYVFKKEGISIPRTALEQYDSLSPVNTPEPGDLVFFHTHGQHVSHVGIYLGDGYFIHSPGQGQHVRVDSLDSGYWETHYAGARRALSWNYMNDQFHNDNDNNMDLNNIDNGTNDTVRTSALANDH